MLSARTIRDEYSNLFTYRGGDLAATALLCRRPDECCAKSLVYVGEPAQLADALRLKPAIMVVQDKLFDALGTAANADTCVFTTRGIPMAMATLLKYFDHKTERFTQWGERHPTALVHATAVIGARTVLGPYCVIGAETTLGEDCIVGSHTVVENKVRIGARTLLHPHVFVGSATVIGSDCEIHPHTSIGSDGFGYAPDAGGRPLKIAQLGNVEIGDHVEIGSNCAIDRATLTSTHIRSGAKLDNICHIAHNCDLGEDGMYTAGFMMAGSTKIGRRFMTGGNSVVSAHLTLCDDVILAGRSSVTNDITAAGAYGGYPLKPLKEALKMAVNMSQLGAMRKDLRRILKHLGLDEAD